MTQRYEFTVTVDDQGRIHAHVLHRGVFVAHRTFTSENTMMDLHDWMTDSSVWTRSLAANNVNHQISYDHADGKLHVVGFVGTHNAYDPLSDESMARMVRHLKRVAPILHVNVEQPTLDNLPIPTDEQLAARTIYTNLGIADGAGKYHRPQPRYNKSSVSAARSQELVKSILADMFDF